MITEHSLFKHLLQTNQTSNIPVNRLACATIKALQSVEAQLGMFVTREEFQIWKQQHAASGTVVPDVAPAVAAEVTLRLHENESNEYSNIDVDVALDKDTTFSVTTATTNLSFGRQLSDDALKTNAQGTLLS